MKNKYTHEEDDYLIKNYDYITAIEAAEHLKRTVKSIYSRVNRLRRKGYNIAKKDPSAEGLKYAIKSNTHKAGTISVRICSNTKKAYKWIKLPNGKSRRLHLHLWEKANGKLPRNKVLRFKDGNHLNCTLDNIICVSRAKIMKENQNGYKTRETIRVEKMGGLYESILLGYVKKY